MADEKKEDKSKLTGFYRAKVVDNKDPQQFGRVKVWLPDIMPKIPESKGLFALPANNPISGLNSDGNSEHHFSGTCYIPPIGSYVWCFFENGNPNRPYYLGGLNLQNTKILPECQVGSNPQKKWVIYKSHSGRTIVISDDPDDERVEITGKKRQISSPPSGDTASVYTIDGNQTSILIDERSGKEKVLIRSHKGDYINFDIENQKLQISVQSDIHLKSNGNIFIKATDDINLKAGSNINLSSGGDVNIKAGGNVNSQASGNINNLAGGPVNLDGSAVNEMCGAAGSATDATGATPNGDR
jgi:hypothetical protein